MADDLGELIELPDGQRLYFRESDHSYWRCKPDGKRGKRLTGVTTAIKPIDFDSERLLKWAARENGKGIAALAAEGLSCEDADEMRQALDWLTDHESIWNELESHALTFNDIRDAKGKTGTAVHEDALGAMARGDAVPDFSKLGEEEAGYVEGVMDFFLDHEPRVSHVEQVVADSEGIGVAGTFDLRCELSSECARPGCPCHRFDGPGIIDAKTSRYLFESPHVQITGYRKLADLCGVGATNWGAILWLRPDGTYELVEAQASVEEFEGCVSIYRAKARIKSAAGKAQKAAREAVAA